MTRWITGFGIAVFAIAMCFFRGWIMRAALLFVAELCVYETYEVIVKKDRRPVRVGGYLFPILATALCFLKFECRFAPLTVIDPIALSLCVCVILTLTLVTLRGGVNFEDAVYSVFPLIYPGLPAVMLYLNQYIGGVMLSTVAVMLAFATAWIGDVFAMLFGIRFGRHKLAPKLSPKKSVEGCVAGLMGSVLAAIAVPLFANWTVANIDRFSVYAAPLPPLFAFAVLGLFAGAAGQLGDLTASMVKRWGGVKDYGTIFPGHGGMMDRMDGVLFSGSVCYVFLMLFAVL